MRHRTDISGAILLLLCGALPSAAQTTRTVTIAGHATNPQGGPVAGLEVLLHRVDESGGARLGSTTSDSTGAFSISAEAVADTTAVYFAAARFNGELYIGPFVREPDGSEPYTLEVGGQPVDLGPPIPSQMSPVAPGGGPRRQLLILFPLVGLMGVAIWAVAKAARPPSRRRALVRLAALDEELAGAGSDPHLENERARIMERLLNE